MREVNHCVVIGAGVAGLASAVWMAESGFRVTLLERRASLGGRTYAVEIPQVGDVADNGVHVMSGSMEELLRYLETIGTRDLLAVQSGTYARRLLPGGEVDGTSLFRTFAWLPAASIADRLRVWRAYARIVRDCVRPPHDLDDITVEEWLDRIGMPKIARDTWIDFLIIGAHNEKPNLLSANAFRNLLVTMGRRGRGAARNGSLLYSTVDFTSLFVTGAEKVLANHGCEVRGRAVVRSIVVRENVVQGVTLADGEFIPANAVICAVPPWAVEGLLDGVPGREQLYRAAANLVPAPLVSVYLYLNKSLGLETILDALLGGEGVVEQVFDRQKMVGYDGSERGLYSYEITVSAAYALNSLKSSSQIVDTCMRFLRNYYPAAQDAELVHAHVVRMPRATYSERPGTAGTRPPQRTGVCGLALAGDWTATDFPSTIGGAAQSAELATRVILDQVPVT
ncbi:MAG: hydroxysqualene dehydroxylase [Mycobacterium sp.]